MGVLWRMEGGRVEGKTGDSVDSVDPILWAEKKFLVWRMASLCGWCLSIGPVAVLLPLKQYSVHFYDDTTPERGFC